MNELIVVIAQYVLYVLVVIAAGVWLTRDRPDKVRLAAEAVVGLVLVGIAMLVAGHLHTDPRPFVHDPHSMPLFPHAADNGFPSDHSLAGGLLAALVFRYKRWWGLLVAAGAVAIDWARVAAHVHHAQDVVAGALIGVAAGALAVWIVHVLLGRLAGRAWPWGPMPAPPPTATGADSQHRTMTASPRRSTTTRADARRPTPRQPQRDMPDRDMETRRAPG